MENSLLKSSLITSDSGLTAVHAAACHGGRNLWNERTGDLSKYAWRTDVHDSGIVLPQAVADNSDYAWARDPHRLWNTVEKDLEPKTSWVRLYSMVLPREMSKEQRRELVYRFSQGLADTYGNAVDVTLHEPRKGESYFPSALLLATTRKIGPQGLLEPTAAEVKGFERIRRGLLASFRHEHEKPGRIWAQMLYEATKEAQLPDAAYEVLHYHQYLTAEYRKKEVEDGFDLKAQRREEVLKRRLNAKERQEAAKRKQIIVQRQWNSHQGMNLEPAAPLGADKPELPSHAPLALDSLRAAKEWVVDMARQLGRQWLASQASNGGAQAPSKVVPFNSARDVER